MALLLVLIPVESAGAGDFPKDNLLMYGGQWTFAFTVYYPRLGDRFSREASFRRFAKNFTVLPEFKDGDSFTTNFVAHPLFGAFTYYVFRERGYSAKKSFGAAALQSTLFEYTLEGLLERPSATDLLVTPLIGAPLGAKMKKWVIPSIIVFAIAKKVFKFK